MPYPRNYKATSYMDDTVLLDIMNQILSMSAGDALRVEFNGTKALASTRYKLYALLNGLGRKEDFKTKKISGTVLEIRSAVDGVAVKEVKLVTREEETNE